MITSKHDEEFQVFREWWGLDAEIVLAMEECAELIQEFSKELRKQKRRDSLAEEMADVYMMVREIEIGLGLEAQVNMHIEQKVKRTWKRMMDEKETFGGCDAANRNVQTIKKPDSQ